jgi:AcrR family transcriptional regulator
MAQVEVPNRRERKKAATRARIIEEAILLFQRRGYQATTIEDITEAADVAPRTFYSYFDAKVDVAMAQFEEWSERHIAAMEARPSGENPFEMATASLEQLSRMGYRTSERPQAGGDLPYTPNAVAVVLSETEPEVAGRVFQVMMAFQTRATELFRARLGYQPDSIEPRVIAAAVTASWFVAVYGFGDILAAGNPEPPSIDELGLFGLAAYGAGLAKLWEGRLGG